VKRNFQFALVWALISLTPASCSRWTTNASAAVSEGVPVRTAVAVVQDVPLDISAVGNIEAINSVQVKSRIAGQVKRVAFEEGQNVTKGQLLFSIDLDTLQRQAEQQQAELERDTAMEQQARAVVARDTAAQKQSRSEADTALELAKDGILSRQRTDQLVTASETSGAILQSDRAAVEAAVGTVHADKARLAQTQLQLGFANVVAPITGRAGAVMVKAGNMVRDNDSTLVSLLQLAPIDVAFGVPEQSLAEIQRLNASGQLTVEVTNGDGPAHEGRLAFIDNTVDATSGTIRLKAAFPNTDGTLWPGEFVNVRLRLQMELGRTVIPSACVQDGMDGKYVWLIKSGIAMMTPVKVRRTYKPDQGPELAVLDRGIDPGSMVVKEGQLRLTSGAKVSLLN
jgi:multidrug efflux system membrane fusion protein